MKRDITFARIVFLSATNFYHYRISFGGEIIVETKQGKLLFRCDVHYECHCLDALYQILSMFFTLDVYWWQINSHCRNKENMDS